MYDLDTLEELAGEMGLRTVRSGPNVLEVHAEDSVVLEFQNLPDENDALVGFQGTPWHYHGQCILGTAPGTYVELNELDVLTRWTAGDLVVVDSYVAGALRDRCLAHKDETVTVKHMEAGEEIRVRRIF